jgi:hypothetical protein
VNLSTIAALVAILSLTLLAYSRVPRRHRRWVQLILLLPGAVLVIRWAAYRQAWLELGVSTGLSLLLILAWWLAVGRKLPPPHEGNIRVWTEEDPF